MSKTIYIKQTRCAGHCWRSKDELISDVLLGPLHTDVQVLADQQELKYNTPRRTQDAVYKTYRKQWMIETNDERESGKCVRAERPDNDL